MILKPRFSRRCIIVVALTLAFGLGSSVWAAADPASLLPADTFLVVHVPSVNAIRAKFKKTSNYGLYKEPAMQQFIQPTEKKIREFIDEKLKEAWKKIGLENPPEKLPIPEGQVMLGMRIRVMKVKRRVIVGWTENDEPQYKTIDAKESKPEIIALAEMGESMETAKTIIAKAVEKAVDEGYKRAEETIRGVKVITVSEPRKGDDDVPVSDDEPIIYAIKDKTIIFTSSMGLMKHMLVRMSGDEAANLADDPDYRRIKKKLGPADVTFFLSGKAIVNLIKADADAGEAEKTDKMIRAFGLDNLVGLGATLSIAPKPTEEMRLKIFAGARGKKTGLMALLTPKPMSTKPTRLLTKGLAAFFVANYDLGKVFDQIAAIVLAIEGTDINKSVQQAMAATGQPDEGGRPPVNLRKDVLGQMSGPVVVTNWIDKPFTAADASKMLFAVGARDRGILDAALGRIHDVFLARGDKELRRELRNITMYMIPGNPMQMIMGLGMGGGMGGQKMTAFAVPGNHFVFGSVGVVEQFIRNLERKDVQGIASDPMYRYASRYLPAQAGMFFYQNGQASTEAVWVQLKDAAKKKAAGAEDDQSEEMHMEMGASANPMSMMVKMLEKHCDFTTLPEFSAVRKYFGPSVGYVVGTEDGIYCEVISLKAPPVKPE